jgi:hypothetical protein
MTTNVNIPKILKENKMSEEQSMGAMKKLVGKKVSKDYSFMGSKIKICKLTVDEVLEIQTKAKAQQGKQADDEDPLSLLKDIIRLSAPESHELTEEDFANLPFDELKKLSNEIMSYSGMDTGQVGNG